MIPDAAVEAAWIELYESKFIGGVGKADMRRALEAAAPHMLVEAWDDGCRQGYREGADDDLILPTASNPYRPTK